MSRPRAPRRFVLPALGVLCGLALLLGLAAGCFGPDVPEVRLGLVATFSGENFRGGRDALDAARFAAEQARARGWPTVNGQVCRIRIFPRDDRNLPEEAARVVRELVDSEHVTAIIGPLTSGVADAAAKAAEAAGVPLVTPSATAAVVTTGRPHIFRVTFTDGFQGLVLGRLAVRELGAHTVAVLANEGNLSSRSLSAAFIRAATNCGGRAVLTTYAERDRDFGPVLKKALADAPDALFLPNPNKEVVLQGLAARQLGFTGLLLGGDSWNGPEISSLKAFVGAVFVDHWREDAPGKVSRAYAAAFRQARRGPATEMGALTHDAVNVVLTAVAQADSVATEAVTRQLMAMPAFDGVTGRFDFVDDGNPVKSLFISRVTKGGSHLETIKMPPPEPCRP